VADIFPPPRGTTAQSRDGIGTVSPGASTGEEFVVDRLSDSFALERFESECSPTAGESSTFQQGLISLVRLLARQAALEYCSWNSEGSASDQKKDGS
jgi:hypothetical protein